MNAVQIHVGNVGTFVGRPGGRGVASPVLPIASTCQMVPVRSGNDGVVPFSTVPTTT